MAHRKAGRTRERSWREGSEGGGNVERGEIAFVLVFFPRFEWICRMYNLNDGLDACVVWAVCNGYSEKVVQCGLRTSETFGEWQDRGKEGRA